MFSQSVNTKSYFIVTIHKEVQSTQVSIKRIFTSFLFTLLPNLFHHVVSFQLASFRLGVTQSEMAQKFESASSLLADIQWNSLENQSVNSVQVFKPQMQGVETVTYSFKCKKSFVFVEVIHLYIFLFLVQRKAEAQYNKTISEPTLESFVWNGI